MTVRVNKSSFNIREKLSELGRKFGLKGSELAAAETVQEAREIISAGRKNILVNGSMMIAQRATQVTGQNSTGYKTCDRWRLNISSLGTWTIDQSTDAPPGFGNSLKVTCTSADASPGSTDNMIVQQRLEGRSLQCLAWGTGSAKDFTISFYVKSSRAGNASFAILNNDNSNSMVSFPYSITKQDTWEYKTITVPAYPFGTFDNDNARSMQLEWWLNSGTHYTGASTHQTTWASLSQTQRNAHNLAIGREVNDTFQLAGVQMEIGRNATDFEHRSFSEELALCQRYYCKSYNPERSPGAGTSDGLQVIRNYDASNSRSDHPAGVQFPVTMRDVPNITLYSQNGTANRYTVGNTTAGSFVNQGGTVSNILLKGTGSIGAISFSTTVPAAAFAYFHYTAESEL